MRILFEAAKRGYGVSIPITEGLSYDIVVDRGNGLERVQVKTVNSDGKVVLVNQYSMSKHEGGKKKLVKYTPEDFEWLVTYDITTDRCFFIPSTQMTGGGGALYLRLVPPENNRVKGIRWAKDFENW